VRRLFLRAAQPRSHAAVLSIGKLTVEQSRYERALAAAGVDVGDGGRKAMRTTRAVASATGSTRRSSSSIRSTLSVARIAMVWPTSALSMVVVLPELTFSACQ
jgi:hypothetical protein